MSIRAPAFKGSLPAYQDTLRPAPGEHPSPIPLQRAPPHRQSSTLILSKSAHLLKAVPTAQRMGTRRPPFELGLRVHLPLRHMPSMRASCCLHTVFLTIRNPDYGPLRLDMRADEVWDIRVTEYCCKSAALVGEAEERTLDDNSTNARARETDADEIAHRLHDPTSLLASTPGHSEGIPTQRAK
ncbi:hypothetical protein BJ912DRAFT_927486 [Pholiota molesta]|nr:hypothetical protein BJ912DRAFT_927486 [Pholiota molesta]